MAHDRQQLARRRKRRADLRRVTKATKQPVAAVVAPVRDDPASWGPPQIVRIVRPPTIETMVRRGQISAELYQAAREIERIFHAVTSGLFVKVGDLQRSGGGAPGRLTDELAQAYAGRYRPWATELSGKRQAAPDCDEIGRTVPSLDLAKVQFLAARVSSRSSAKLPEHHPETLSVVIAVVVDGSTLATIDQDHGWRTGTGSKLLKAGLTRYAERAGWLAVTRQPAPLQRPA